jgi:periplasmic nitrate reductase NapD
VSEPMLHIASAVVKARPADQHGVAERIAALAGTDVVAIDHGRIIVVLESRQHGDLGDTLNQIAGLDGVLSATLVFEHSEPLGEAA